MKRKKILFGAVDIGWRIATYTFFIEKQLNDKLISESFSKYVVPSSFYKTTYTYTCPVNTNPKMKFYLYCLWFFITALFKYDIFHFFSGETIVRFNFDFSKIFIKEKIPFSTLILPT